MNFSKKVVVFISLVNLLQPLKTRRTAPKPGKVRIPGLPGQIIVIPDFTKVCPVTSPAMPEANISVVPGPGAQAFVNGDGYIVRPLNNITKLVVYIRNCADPTEGSCQLFQTWRITEGICAMIENKDAMWSPALRRIHPEVRCPIQAGWYHMRNGTLNVNLIRHLPFPLEKYYWRVKVQGYDPEPCICVEGLSHFSRIKS